VSTILCHSHQESGRLKQPLQQEPILSMVLSDQYPVLRLAGLEANDVFHVRSRSGYLRCFSYLDGQLRAEPGATPRSTFNLNRSTKELDKMAADAEPQARTFPGSGTPELNEWLEYPRLVLRSNTYSGILDIENQQDLRGAIRRRGVQSNDNASLVGIFQSISNEVRKHLAEFARIGANKSRRS
jgi:hypothetical protein